MREQQCLSSTQSQVVTAVATQQKGKIAAKSPSLAEVPSNLTYSCKSHSCDSSQEDSTDAEPLHSTVSDDGVFQAEMPSNFAKD